MKASIIGANSYIARNLIAFISRLVQEEVELKLYDIQDSHFDGYLNYCRINMLDRNEIEKIDLDVDAVFVFTGKTGTYKGFTEYEDYIRINEVSLLNLLNEYVSQNSKAKLVFPSTRLVYRGKKGRIAEDSEKEFKTVYSINKYACEQYLQMYHNSFDVQYAVFRICVPYGSLIDGASSYGTAEFMISNASKGQDITLFGDGEVRRTLTNILDLCRALYEGAKSKNCLNDVFNIGGEDYSLREMATLISNKYKNKVSFTEWPVEHKKIESGDTVFDSGKFDKATGFEYLYSFSEWLEGKNH